MQSSTPSVDFKNLLNPNNPATSASASASTSASTPTSDPSIHPLSHQSNSSQPMATAGVSLMAPLLHNTQPDTSGDQPRQELPRPYKCPMCDKAFHRLEHQTRHIRTHTGEKPHACQFPGCTKRFSRSDELTRHSRIHNNPNSRRGNKHTAAQVAAAAAVNGGILDQPSSMAHMMPPPPKTLSRSAPSSNIGSPNISPPHSFTNTSGGSVGPMMYNRTPGSNSSSSSPNGLQRQLDINILATAASEVEREHNSHHSNASRHPFQQPLHPGYHHRDARLPSLAAYAYSQPMSRSHSHEDDDQYGHRMTKKSRPGSPFSTNPPSPSYSHDSYSPTPDHTPLATPAHSPRLRPQYFHHDNQLPGLRHLSLHQPPALAPIEPQADTQNHQTYVPSHTNGIRIGDILTRTEGSQRKLPVPAVPKVAVQDIFNGRSGFSSGTSSANASIAGDLNER